MGRDYLGVDRTLAIENRPKGQMSHACVACIFAQFPGDVHWFGMHSTENSPRGVERRKALVSEGWLLLELL